MISVDNSKLSSPIYPNICDKMIDTFDNFAMIEQLKSVFNLHRNLIGIFY